MSNENGKRREPRQKRGIRGDIRAVWGAVETALAVATKNAQSIELLNQRTLEIKAHAVAIERALAVGAPTCRCSHAHGFHGGEHGGCLAPVYVDGRVTAAGQAADAFYLSCACNAFTARRWFDRGGLQVRTHAPESPKHAAAAAGLAIAELDGSTLEVTDVTVKPDPEDPDNAPESSGEQKAVDPGYPPEVETPNAVE